MSGALIQVELACALPHRAIVKSLHLAPGSCVADALRLAALDPDFSGVDLVNSPVGIFGKLTGTDQVLNEGDRIEVYRPLAADPKAARRARAKSARQR